MPNWDDGVAVLRILIDQYQLKADDLKNEIGSKSLVSMILNGSRKFRDMDDKRPYCLTITRRGNLILTSADDDADKPTTDRSTERPTE